MAKRKLTKQQIRRIQNIQQQRLQRAQHKQQTLSQQQTHLAPEQDGIIITNYGVAQIVETNTNKLARCVARQNLGTLVCGDQIIWREAIDNPGNGVITALKPRHSLLTRPTARDQQKPLAANLDQIMIVISATTNFRPHTLDRYLIASHLTQIPAIIIISKTDTLTSSQYQQLQQYLSHYQDIGYPLLFTSIQSGQGMEQLLDRLRQKTSIFIGPSGVGKSSLIHTLLPTQDIRIGTVSELTGQGRHTTTASTLYHLPHSGDLIDSPGVRNFDLGKITLQQISAGFIEFHEFLGHCRFNNCQHINEPKCAIHMAAIEGKIHPQRLQSYQDLMQNINV